MVSRNSSDIPRNSSATHPRGFSSFPPGMEFPGFVDLLERWEKPGIIWDVDFSHRNQGRPDQAAFPALHRRILRQLHLPQVRRRSRESWEFWEFSFPWKNLPFSSQKLGIPWERDFSRSFGRWEESKVLGNSGNVSHSWLIFQWMIQHFEKFGNVSYSWFVSQWRIQSSGKFWECAPFPGSCCNGESKVWECFPFPAHVPGENPKFWRILGMFPIPGSFSSAGSKVLENSGNVSHSWIIPVDDPKFWKTLGMFPIPGSHPRGGSKILENSGNVAPFQAPVPVEHPSFQKSLGMRAHSQLGHS